MYFNFKIKNLDVPVVYDTRVYIGLDEWYQLCGVKNPVYEWCGDLMQGKQKKMYISEVGCAVFAQKHCDRATWVAVRHMFDKIHKFIQKPTFLSQKKVSDLQIIKDDVAIIKQYVTVNPYTRIVR